MQSWYRQGSDERSGPDPVGGHPLIRRVALPGVRALTRVEALSRLSTVSVGRVAWTVRALPALATVRFYVTDGDVVFGAGLADVAADAGGQIVAFAADGVDRAAGTCWEVSLVGLAQPVDLEEWPSGVGPAVRVAAQIVSGVTETARSSAGALGLAGGTWRPQRGRG